jgi:TRAP-type C4-dicarboxylate transport system substrate-binding protein
MMKKCIGIISLLVVLSLVFSFISCSQSPSTTTTSPTTAATTSKPATSAPATTAPQPVTLKFAAINVPPPPAKGGQTEAFANQFNLIESKTNGRVKFDVYWGETLVPATQLVNAISTGVADMGGLDPSGEPGKLALSSIGGVPGFGTDYWAQCMAYWDILNTDALLGEFAKFNALPISLDYFPDMALISRVPIKSLADLKGKKVAAPGFPAQVMDKLGAVIVGMAPPEMYEGMQKGTIDAIGAPWSAIEAFKFYEAGHYVTAFPLGGGINPMGINKNAWNKISPQDQAIIKSLIPDIIQICTNAMFVKDQPMYPLSEQVVKDNNLQLFKPSAEDVAAILKVQATIADTWAAEKDKAGLPGSKVLADYRGLVDKYSKVSTFPFK